MSITFQADLKEFSKTLNDYLSLTSRELSAAINNKTGRVAWRALNLTPKVDKREIEKLGISGYHFVKAKKSNKIRKVYTVYNKYGAARNIVAARYWKRGEKIESSFKLETDVQEMLKARIKSIAFVKSGWLPAYRAFRRFIEGIPPDNTAKQKGKPKGEGKPSKPGFNPLAMIANSALPNTYTEGVATDALGKAMRDESANMKVYIERKMREAGKKTGVNIK